MSRRRKKCRCCREPFDPHPQTYRQQITCDKPACRSWRLRRAQKNWRGDNPLYEDSRIGKRKRWREKNGAAYMREYRGSHEAYVERNRQKQRDRDRQKGNLVKQNEWSQVCIENAARIRRLRFLVKQNEWMGVMWREIDGIWWKLSRFSNLVKQNDMA